MGTAVPDLKDPAYNQYQKRRRNQWLEAEASKPSTSQLLERELRGANAAAAKGVVASVSRAERRVNAQHMHGIAPGVDVEALKAARATATVLDLFETQAYWRTAVAMQFLPPSEVEVEVKQQLQKYCDYIRTGKYRGCYTLKPEFLSDAAREVQEATAAADAAEEAEKAPASAAPSSTA